MNRCFTKVGLLALTGLLSTPVIAGEGGQSRYVPGSFATLIDIPPTQPGWVFEAQLLNYEGDASISLPIAGELTVSATAKSTAALLGGVYTLSDDVWGAKFTVGGFLPLVSMDVTADVAVAEGGLARRNDSESGLGDLVLIPAMMAWKSDYWTYSATLFAYAPTGDYKVGRLANPGLNYWSLIPTAGLAYNNETNGFNFSINAGLDINGENDDTDYQTGSSLHLDASVQQILPVGDGFLTLGLEAFWLEQTENDSGTGARLGGFKGKTQGYGPVIGYVLPVGKSTAVAEFRWLHESNVENRPEGDFLWLKFVYQFGADD